MIARLLQGMGRATWLSRFAKDKAGASAAEFALILPVMLIMYFGGWGVSQAISANRLVALTAGTVTNLVSQYTTISQSQQMPDILGASTQIMAQYPGTKPQVVISQIQIDATGKATIQWSQTLNGTARVVGAVVSLPAALDTPNTYVLWGETSYPYTPGVSFPNLGTMNLYSSVYMLPRASNLVTLVA